MGHKNVPNIVSLSHCLEQLYSCIFNSYLCKGKKETHVYCFVYFLSACALMRTRRFTVMSCVCLLINYTLATEEIVHYVRVCACCNHFSIT